MMPSVVPPLSVSSSEFREMVHSVSRRMVTNTGKSTMRSFVSGRHTPATAKFLIDRIDRKIGRLLSESEQWVPKVMLEDTVRGFCILRGMLSGEEESVSVARAEELLSALPEEE